MKILSPQIKEHISNETTTLCRCWVLEISDGEQLGFTDHDDNIVLNGVICEKDAGVEAGAIEERIGLNTNTNEVAGALQSEFITSDDIDAGKYDNARVSTYIVNWQNPSENFLDQVSLIGEIVKEDGHYRMELRSLASQLDQTKGNHFIKRCQADLGDEKCKVSLDSSYFLGSGQVVDIKSSLVLWVSGLAKFENGWFRGGHLTWVSGVNISRKIEITEHITIGDIAILHMWQPMPSDVKKHDRFSIRVGCNKEFSTCSSKFKNTINFRGFPHMPGNAFALSYAGNSDSFDGGPIIK